MGDEWSLLIRHARRVRAVFLQGSEGPGEARFATDLASLDILREYLPHPVFPRLRYLKLTKEFLTRAPAFLHSRLESITIYGIEAEGDFTLFLQKIQSTAPNLQMLHVTRDSESDDCSRAQISKIACALAKLESLDGWYHPLTKEAIAHLSNLPRFRTLSLLADQSNVRIWDLPSLGRFSSLTSLKLAFTPHTTPAEWTRFLRALVSAPLERISVVVWTPDECHSTELIPFLEALGQFTHLSACEATMMSEATRSVWDDTYLYNTALHPLLRARNMCSFTLEQFPISFASPLLEEMAEAWPRLETIVLQPELELCPEYLPPLADLLHFTQRCPDLREVDMEFEGMSDEWTYHEHDEPEPDIPPSTLEHLKMQTTYIERLVAPLVATFLDRYFPKTRLSGDSTVDDELGTCDIDYVNQLRTRPRH